MSEMFLGIDIGGTGSRWAVCDRDGLIVQRGAAAGATGHLFAREARVRFEAAIAEIAGAIPVGAIAGVELGATGLGADQSGRAAEIVGAALGIDPARIGARDDIEMAYRLVFAPGEGHLISAGTGSIGVHVRTDGALIRVGGRGVLVDDAGSGAWIALRAIDRVYREVDEKGAPERTAKLADALFAFIGGRDWDCVRAFVYGGERGRIGELARAVGLAAEAGSQDAAEILGAAGIELARLALALEARCGPAPVTVIGRVPAISPLIGQSLAQALPGRTVHFDTIDQALGAARLAGAAAQTRVGS